MTCINFFKNLVEVYRREIVPIADVLVPNQFEAEHLTGMKIKTEEDGWKVSNGFDKYSHTC